MEQKFEDAALSSLEEKVDLENLVLYPSESYISEGIDEEIFRVKDEPLENEINNDISETATPHHKYEETPIEFSTNNKEESLEEKVNLENLVLYPSELYISKGREDDIFRIKDEPLENETNNDNSETAIPHHKYEKSPIEFSTNKKEQKVRDFFCFQCSLQFGAKSVYDLHQSLVHGIKVLGKSGDSEVKMQIESDILQSDNEPFLSTDQEEGNKSFNCNNCSKMFSQEGDLNRHIKSVHEGKKPFKCNICGTAFSYTQSLNRHHRSVHEGKKPFKCNVCDAKFLRSDRLKVHFESVHKGKKSFKCNDCGKDFSQKSGLKQHIESVHEGKKPFICSICDAGFSRKGSMNGHIDSVHKGNKPFKCNDCASAFSNKGDLNRHIKSVHEGNKPL